jgi:UDP-N-acetyl-D-mannosaminuronate dehydrogenase
MPYYVVDRLAEALDRTAGGGLNRAKIMLVGTSYKKNVDDMRESPSFNLIELLARRGAKVDYHDPCVPEIPATGQHAALAGRRSKDIASDTLSSYGAVLMATDHAAIDSLTSFSVQSLLLTPGTCVPGTAPAARKLLRLDPARRSLLSSVALLVNSSLSAHLGIAPDAYSLSE